MIHIKEANFEDIEKEWLFVKDMPEDENGLTNEWSGISREDFENRALPQMLDYSKGVGLADWLVPETFLFLWDDDVIVGQFRIRHYLNDALREGSGHIGYYIGKQFRGKHYATQGLKLTLEIAKNIVPEEEFYLRVNKDNPASLKVMLNNGGRIAYENEEKYFVRIINPGKSITLKEVTREEIETVWQMQTEAFSGLLKKYQDYDTSPGAEAFEKVLARFEQPWTTYYFIVSGKERVGVIRIIDKKDGSRKRISPVWILEEYRNRGYAQDAIKEAERIYGSDNWCLDTILQEEGNLHLYEKLGYHQTGKTERINERMDIVFYEKN